MINVTTYFKITLIFSRN